ncbi:MAG: hypothetical protein ACI9LU_000573 [Polaribacter sp.]|jgi:hypothetical protein
MIALRQIVLGYALFVLLLITLFKVVVLPFYMQWQSSLATSQKLQRTMDKIESQIEHASLVNHSMLQALQSKIDANELSVIDSESHMAKALQSRLNTVLKDNSGTVLQLRPSQQTISKNIHKSSLELSLRLSTDNLQGFFTDLAHSTPKIHVELFNARHNARFGNKFLNQIDVSLTVSRYLLKSSAQFDIDSLVRNVLVSDSLQANAVDSQVNVLSGLFNPNVRARLRSPSASHYRLAAINMSNQGRSVIVVNSSDGLTRKLTEGERLDSWLLTSIKADEIVLSMGDIQTSLTLSQ